MDTSTAAKCTKESILPTRQRQDANMFVKTHQRQMRPHGHLARCHPHHVEANTVEWPNSVLAAFDAVRQMRCTQQAAAEGQMVFVPTCCRAATKVATVRQMVCSQLEAGCTLSSRQLRLLSGASPLSTASLVRSVEYSAITAAGSTPLCLLLLIFSINT